MDKLLDARSQIDKIDDQIMELLDERFALSIQIGTIKKEIKSPILDSNREQKILEKTSKLSHSHTIRNVYKSIMDESKKLQGK
jgi:monofunctional chorismate mutase